MSYFIYEGEVELNQKIRLSGEEADHLIKSRRVREGEHIEVQDRRLLRFSTRIEEILKHEIILSPIEKLVSPPESLLKIHLFQALIKEKQLDLVLQKATELGAASVNVFQCAYSQSLKKDIDKQLTRWKKICIEACKQSGRVEPPILNFYESLFDSELLDSFRSKHMQLLCLETSDSQGDHKPEVSETGEIGILIGPEGGWKEGELSGLPCRKIKLGPRIMRSETAAIAAIAILQYQLGDMSFDI